MKMHKQLLSIILISFFSFGLSMSMEQDHSEYLNEPIAPYASVPFKHIPKYIYENCNQVTKHSFTREVLDNMKLKVQNLCSVELNKKFKDPKAYEKFAELYDWIYGLYYLEQTYLNNNQNLIETLNIEEIKNINGRFSRLIAENPGEFRKVGIAWKIKHLNPTEQVLMAFFDQHAYDLLPIISEDGFIDSHVVKRELEYYKKNPFLVEGDLKVSDINPNEVDSWLKEQEIKNNQNNKSKKKYRTKKLNLVQWLEEREHKFPPAELIAEQLNQALVKLKDMKDPIEQAAFIWWEMVRIHISHEANKRTGKALASIILLQNGYLPPLITAEDEKEYIETFIQGFDREDWF